MPNERHWVMTAWDEPLQFAADQKEMEYLIYGIENTTRGIVHYQSYVEFRKKVSMQFVKNFFNDDTIHLHKRDGTQAQAIAYCKKEGDFYEIGTPNYSGKRTDLEDSLRENLSVVEFAANDPTNYVRFHNGIKSYYAIKDHSEQAKFTEVKLHVYWGKAGTGKTKSIMDSVPDKDYYYWTPSCSMNSGPWFDNYCGEKHLILDDFYGNMPYSFFLQLTDPWRKPIKLPYKGGHVVAKFTDVWVSSNSDPFSWYSKVSNREGLIRRLNCAEIHHLGDDIVDNSFVFDSSCEKCEIDSHFVIDLGDNDNNNDS